MSKHLLCLFSGNRISASFLQADLRWGNSHFLLGSDGYKCRVRVCDTDSVYGHCVDQQRQIMMPWNKISFTLRLVSLYGSIKASGELMGLRSS